MYQVDIIEHSINPFDQELITARWTFPRIILAEINTHRMESRNTSSSRAIPTKFLLNQVASEPYIPDYVGKNTSGMQAKEELSEENKNLVRALILRMRDFILKEVENLRLLGLHKQDLNRYLEPWMWCTQVITSSNFANLLHQRTHKDAHPAFKRIANELYEKLSMSMPTLKDWGQWHLPFVTAEDKSLIKNIEDLKILSIARCARTSFTIIMDETGKEATINLEKALDIYNKLMSGEVIHRSPFEHVAVAQPCGRVGNLIGWIQARKYIKNEYVTDFKKPNGW